MSGEPYQSFHTEDRADTETAVLLLIVGLIVSQLTARARTLKVDGWVWDLERQGRPEGEIELRAIVHGRYQGRFLLTPEPGSVPPSLEARLVAADLAAQAAAALDDDSVSAGRRS
ncbi:hypothetical protein ACFRJ7_28800 [Streptomyces sp. NPDC056747]|uniref:hypothetical protein n=1 Tax=Streptomyces sp. NPDC056747 TaxID=3345935 RepID=UPI0036C090BB